MVVYPEFLRVRRAITWFVIIACAFLLLDLATVVAERIDPVHFRATVHGITGTFPFSFVFPVVGFFTAIVATTLGASLNRMREHAEIVLTLPLSRTRFAVSVIWIDVLGIAATFIIATLLVIALPFTINGVWPAVAMNWGDFPASAGQALGAAVMWFALIAAVSAWIPGRGGAVAGLSWPVFLVLAAMHELTQPAWLASLVHLLNYLNPLLYVAMPTSGRAHPIVDMPFEVQLIFVWFVALIACIIAIAGWNRQEI